jgi:hypothetical protein
VSAQLRAGGANRQLQQRNRHATADQVGNYRSRHSARPKISSVSESIFRVRQRANENHVSENEVSEGDLVFRHQVMIASALLLFM